MTEKKGKKSNFGKGLLQFIIFFFAFGFMTVYSQKSLLGIILLILILFRYCFVSKDDKNIFFNKEGFKNHIKSKKRWIRFIILAFISGYSALLSYQGKYSEQITGTITNMNQGLEQFTEDLEQGTQDLTDKAVEEVGKL